jgi:hypothetical protein
MTQMAKGPSGTTAALIGGKETAVQQPSSSFTRTFCCPWSPITMDQLSCRHTHGNVDERVGVSYFFHVLKISSTSYQGDFLTFCYKKKQDIGVF